MLCRRIPMALRTWVFFLYYSVYFIANLTYIIFLDIISIHNSCIKIPREVTCMFIPVNEEPKPDIVTPCACNYISAGFTPRS